MIQLKNWVLGGIFALSIHPLAADEAVSVKSHRVAEGDTLWGISGHYLGDPMQWPKIWQANKNLIENPHWIYPGQEIAVGTTFSQALPEAPQSTAASEPAPTAAEPEIIVAENSADESRPPAASEVGEVLAIPSVKEAGLISRTFNQKMMVEPGDEVKIKLKRSAKIQAGSTLVIWRPVQFLIDGQGEEKEEGEISAEVIGTLRILKKTGPERALAKIVSVTGPVVVGDRLKFGQTNP